MSKRVESKKSPSARPQSKKAVEAATKPLGWKKIEVNPQTHRGLFLDEGNTERFLSLEVIDGNAIADDSLLGKKRNISELAAPVIKKDVLKRVRDEKDAMLMSYPVGQDGFVYFKTEKEMRQMMNSLKALNEKAEAESRGEAGTNTDNQVVEPEEEEEYFDESKYIDYDESDDELQNADDEARLIETEEDCDPEMFGFGIDEDEDKDEDEDEDHHSNGIDFEGLVDFDAVGSLEELEALDAERAREATHQDEDEDMEEDMEEDAPLEFEDEDALDFEDEDALELDDEAMEEFKVSEDAIPESLKLIASTMEVGNKPEDFLAWEPYGLHPLLLQGIQRIGFKNPTPIQEECLHPAIKGWKDVVGAAQTGSGKTLAFGLPILQAVIENRERVAAVKQAEAEAACRKNLLLQAKQTGVKVKQAVLDTECAKAGAAAYEAANGPASDSLTALILTPTRELAVQIVSHLDAVAKEARVRCLAVVGGLAVEKQKRVLTKNKPPIIVATPGRLWELIAAGTESLMDLIRLRFFVLDEADRMVANGSFPELDSIISYIQSFRDDLKELKPEERARRFVPKRMQIFLFSATLTLKDEGHHKKKSYLSFLKKKHKKRGLGKNKEGDAEEVPGRNLLAELARRLPFEGKPHVADLSSRVLISSSIRQEYVQTLDDERDDILYYLLHNFTGRALVFVNAVSIVKRISNILSALNIRCHSLHAHLLQRQRLKILDRFKSEARSVIVCTDVAARGLDIANVDLVIHFHFPRTPEIYVHRTGRTGRAGAEGRSVLVVGPKDSAEYERLVKILGPVVEANLLLHRPDSHVLKMVHSRVACAQKIAAIYDKVDKANAEVHWLEKVAEGAGLDAEDADAPLDEDSEYLGRHLGQKKQSNTDSKDVKSSKQQKGGRSKAAKIAAASGLDVDSDNEDTSSDDEELEEIRAHRARVKTRELEQLKQQLAAMLAKPIRSKVKPPIR